MSVVTRANSKKFEEAQALYPIPDGWTLKSSIIDFTPDQWGEISDATKADKTTVFHKVSVSEAYHVMTDNDGSINRLVTDRVKSWQTKMFALIPPNALQPCLFVPQTFSRDEADLFDRDTRLKDYVDISKESSLHKLVLLVPADVNIQVSCIAALDGEVKGTLREDLILMFHEFDSHPTAAQTFLAVAAVAWWPSMKADIYKHVRYCSLCMSKRAVLRAAGVGTVVTVRHRHIVADHVILPPWMKELTGCGAILVVTDLASGEVDMDPVESTGAMEVVVWLFNVWCRYRGFFVTFGSDHGSAFISKVVDLFFKLIGLKVHRLSAVADSRGMAHVESKNRLVREIQAEISENGSIQSKADLTMFCTRKVIQHTQTRETAGSTVFERCRGVKAITLKELITEEVDIDEDIASLTEMEAQVITRVANTTRRLMQDYNVEQLVRSRDNAYSRDSKEVAKKGEFPDFKVGDVVSMKGKSVEIMDLKGFNGTSHAVAVIAEEGKEPRAVKCEDLREKCWGRPQWEPIRSLESKIGSFILFEDQDSRRGGVVMEVLDTVAVVHEYCANEKRTRWLPVWSHKKLKERIKQDCPDSFGQRLIEVEWAQIILIGKLSGMVMSDDTKRRAIAKGYDWAVP